MAARAKKEVEKNSPAVEALEFEEETPIATQRHRIVTEYTKTIPVEDEERDEIEEIEPAEPAVEAELDPIEALLREIGASPSTWTLVIDRLPNYQKDGAFHTRVKYSRCGTLPLTEDSLRGEGYIEEIQTRWARPGRANDFRLLVRKDNRIYCYLPVLSIEPPDPEVIAKQTAIESPQINFQMPQGENSFDSFIKQAEKMARLREAMGWIAPQTVQNSAASNEPLTTERALLHLIAQDGDVIESFTSKLKGVLRKGDGAREISWMDLVFEAIKSDALPKMIREAKNLITEANSNGQAQMGATQIPFTQNQQADIPTAQVPNDQATTPRAANGAPGVAPPAIELLQFTVTACIQRLDVKEAARRVLSFESLNPEVTPYLNAFSEMPAEAAVQWIAASVPQAASIAQMPHAKQWTEELQKALFAEGEMNDRIDADL